MNQQEIQTRIKEYDWLRNPSSNEEQIVADILGLTVREIQTIGQNSGDVDYLRNLGLRPERRRTSSYVESNYSDTRRDTLDRMTTILDQSRIQGGFENLMMIATHTPENPIWNPLNDHFLVMVPFDSKTRSIVNGRYAEQDGERIQLERVPFFASGHEIDGEEIHYQETLVGWFKDNKLFLRFNPFKNQDRTTGAQGAARTRVLGSILQSVQDKYVKPEIENNLLDMVVYAKSVVATSVSSMREFRNEAAVTLQRKQQAENAIQDLEQRLARERERLEAATTAQEEQATLGKVYQQGISAHIDHVSAQVEACKAIQGVKEVGFENGKILIKTLPLVIEVNQDKRLVAPLSMKIETSASRSAISLDPSDHPMVRSSMDWGNSVVPLAQALSSANFVAVARLALNTLARPSGGELGSLPTTELSVGWQAENE